MQCMQCACTCTVHHICMYVQLFMHETLIVRVHMYVHVHVYTVSHALICTCTQGWLDLLSCHNSRVNSWNSLKYKYYTGPVVYFMHAKFNGAYVACLVIL